MSFKNPRNAWESDPVFGTILLVALGILMPIPMIVISSLFGGVVGPYVWVGMCLFFWGWEVWMAIKPFPDR